MEYTEDELEGMTVQSSDGNKIGKVGQVYYDDATGKAEWVSVSTGLFGSKHTFVPLSATRASGDALVVPFDKDKIKNAPHMDVDRDLTTGQEAELFSYFGIAYGSETMMEAGAPSGDYESAGGASMTRSEERMEVGTEAVETGTARLRKRIVTEDVTQTVPVSHEEVTVEREPLTDANRDETMSGGDLTEDEAVVTLHAEQPVVVKETVPVERVSLNTQTVAGEQTVSDTVREEEIDADLPR